MQQVAPTDERVVNPSFTTPTGFHPHDSTLHIAIQSCSERVSEFLLRELPDSDLEIYPRFKEGRVDLVAKLGNHVLGRTFLTAAECLRSHAADAQSCSEIDRSIASWISVLSHRARQLQRWEKTRPSGVRKLAS